MPNVGGNGLSLGFRRKWSIMRNAATLSLTATALMSSKIIKILTHADVRLDYLRSNHRALRQCYQ